MNKKPIIIFDLDGTLANCEHRKHWITSKPKNWKAFFKGIKGDTPIIPVMSVLTSLLKSNYNIVFMSGRSEDTREDTVQWLHAQGICKDAHYIDLWMRKSNDFRSDDIVKLEILDEIEKMQQDEILRMAIDTGLGEYLHLDGWRFTPDGDDIKSLERFYELAYATGAAHERETFKVYVNQVVADREMAVHDAVLAEREACAKVCDEIEQGRWNLYKGRPPYTGSESGRADPHEQGVSMGAGECAAAIRARSEK